PVQAQRQDVVQHVVTGGDLVKHGRDVAGPLVQAGLRHHANSVLRSGLSRETAPQIMTYRTPNPPYRVKSWQVWITVAHYQGLLCLELALPLLGDHPCTHGGSGRFVDEDDAAGLPVAGVRVAEQRVGQPQRNPADLVEG